MNMLKKITFYALIFTLIPLQTPVVFAGNTFTEAKQIQAYEEPYFYKYNGVEALGEDALVTYKHESFMPINEAARILGLEVEMNTGNIYLKDGSGFQLTNHLKSSLPKKSIDVVDSVKIGTEIGAQSGFVIEDDNMEPVFTKNHQKRMYPSSTTKIMTALLAIEQGNLNDVVTVGASAASVPWDSSRAGVKPGDKMTLEQLLYAMMLPSGNDAAVAIAEHIAGSHQKFVGMMNARSKQLGAKSTSFTNAHGYHHPNLYTTAFDLALIAKEASKHPVFLKIAGTPSYTAKYHNKNGQVITKTWRSTNQLVLPGSNVYTSTVVAGKTGYTSLSRHNLVSFARANDHDYIVVLLRGEREQRYRDTRNLLNSAYKKRAQLNQKKQAMNVIPFQGKVFLNSKDITKQADLFSKDGEVFISINSMTLLSSTIKTTKLSQSQAIKASLEGTLLTFDVDPIIRNGRMLVPARTFFEKAGLELHWNASRKTVEARNEDTVITMQLDSSEVKVNNKVMLLDEPATVYKGRTLVPIRFISESIGSTVDWGRGRTLYFY